VSYGGRQPQRFAAQGDGVIRIDSPGDRWPALARLLSDTHDGWKAYDYIWLPADDIQTTADDIQRLFEIAAALDLQLAMPSLTADSPATHTLARHNSEFGLRYTNFVDPDAALFSRAMLEQALPGLAASQHPQGRDWLDLLSEPAKECAVIDRVQVRRSGAHSCSDEGTLCYGGFDGTGRLHHLFDAADSSFAERLASGFGRGLAAGVTAGLSRLMEAHDAARNEVLATSAPAPSDWRLTLATSLAPIGPALQQRAVASWQALGCVDVVSFNIAAEIRQLQPQYPDVRFIEVQRDGRERTGKPLVRVDDVFAWFRSSGLAHGGFVNSDIVLQPADRAGFLASVRANIDGAMLFSRRIEVESLDRLEGLFYPTGFDLWLWDNAVLDAFDQPTDYYVGFPHWDYYAVLMPLLKGHKIRQFAYPLAYHQKHEMYYDVVRDGIPYGLKTFDLVAPHFNRIPATHHLFTPLLEYFLAHRPASITTQEDAAYYLAFLHALDLWFLDLIDRNSEKIRHADGRAAERDAGIPFLGLGSAPAAIAAAGVKPPAKPLISVIIPTFNRAAILQRCLDHLAAQSLPSEHFEIIVIDDGSSDHTPQVLAAAARRMALLHQRQDNRGPAAARNCGLRLARGDWVLFLNDDALLEPDALAIHLAEHARRGPRSAVLGQFVMHPEFARPDSPIGHCLDRSDLIFEYARMAPDTPYDHWKFYTCNLSVQREFVLRHGGFDEGFVRMGAEDIELGLRMFRDGCRVWYRPDCVARHAHKLDAPGLARMFEFRGRGGVHRLSLDPDERPHFVQMPPARIEEFLAIDQRLQPLLARLEGAIERFDERPYRATGARDIALDETSSGIDLRMLWLWEESDICSLVELLVQRLDRHLDQIADQAAPSLEEAAGRLYPALQFVKWYHDTLGILSSDELRDYLAFHQRQRLAA
jgi:GT2 family glycosyltransferase